MATLTEQVEDKRKLLDQERRILDLAGHRAALQPDEACPLCGSTEHPSINVYRALDVSATEHALKDKELALQGKRKEALAIDVAIAELNAEMRALKSVSIHGWKTKSVMRRAGKSCASNLDSKMLTVTGSKRSCRRTPQR